MTPDRPPLYGLDIETDTSTGGLDPATSRVAAVAIAARDGEVVLGGPEPDLLTELDARLRLLPPGVLVTWNGSGFDLPYLADRAAVAGVPIGLELVPDPSIPGRGEPLAGHSGAYRARWYRHAHLDAYQAYRWAARLLGVSGALKSVARLCGLDTVEVDRSAVHLLADHELERYVASDARLARLLAERRWNHAASFVDAPSGVSRTA